MKVKRSQLALGSQVEVNPQNDRSRKTLVVGTIKEILTNSETHPHGILVQLASGETGRVKRVLDAEANSLEGQKHTGTVTEETCKIDAEFVRQLVASSENYNVEYKTSAFWSLRLSVQQIKEFNSAEIREYERVIPPKSNRHLK